ncbi:MAG: UDP-N-acetylmuramoyl-L-alanyl-D-glutamate--2,6-diaminopimelate ligase [Armatimonadota bacterium]
MPLNRLLAQTPDVRLAGDRHTPITAICMDSRQARPGCLFVAVRGLTTDGHRFIPEAVRAGAAAVAYEDETAVAALGEDVVRLHVPDTRRFAALAATAFYGTPSAELTLIGVTGTNGKTTVTHLLEAIFRAAGASTGLIGTLGRRIGGQSLPAERTTPEAPEIQALLRRMADEGVTHVALEVSSHGLALHRTLGCKFDAAVFTNLTQDHLDFHADLDDYLESKLRLFTDYAQAARPDKDLVGVVNLDDAGGRQIAARARCRLFTYAIEADADLRAADLALDAHHTRFQLELADRRTEATVPSVGRFSVYNALAAAACALALDVDADTIVAALANAPSVPGRFELVDEGQPFRVVVDYAHTPDGLANVLRAARDLTDGRLICVFGCGGDRDHDKRPRMGRVVGELADLAIVTSDNPRSEEPDDIIAQILPGLNGAHYLVEVDREQAIRRGLESCRPGDLLLIAGKGHETYQIFRDRTVEFDDRAVARNILRSLSA